MGIAKKLLDRFGPERFICDPLRLEPYSRDFSLSPPQRPEGVVKVKTAEEVRFVLGVARDYSVPIVPSSSRVHFYGLTIPQKGGLVLDLSEMDRILEIDESNRRVRIEAGVSWGKLCPALREKGLRVMMPLFPHPLRSVITDLLEREPLVNTVYEYGEPLQGMEVVWPNGEIFRTGSASTPGYPDSIAGGVNPTGPGIDFYRLLQGAQGTLAVVTWASLKIETLPKIDKLFFVPLSNLSQGLAFLSTILRLRVGQECFLLNRRVLSLILNRGGGGADGELPTHAIFIVLSGLQRRPELKIAYEEALLREALKNWFPEERVLEEIPHGPPPGEFVKGLRSPWPDPETYWKHRWKKGCQSLFFLTKPSRVERFAEIVKDMANSFGYEGEDIGLYLQPIEHNRACHLEFHFYYDPEDGSERERIQILFREGVRRCLAEGAFFTRPYGEASTLVFERASAYARALKKVKAVFDPLQLMNPGRLCF
ncbi:MAG: FAD-binding oxidoreductase [Desulfobacterota bacterium]|nr:FAD-binding oxidoreductase [Thermodesulfobacteriota bacterium]